MKRNKIADHWNISRDNSAIFSHLARIIVLILFLYIGLNKLIVMYVIFDLSQYFLASISYKILARLQELNKWPKSDRPTVVNYCAYLCYYSKYIILMILLWGLL